VAQTFSWPQAQTLSSKLPIGLWYSSLALSLASICLGTQQSVALNRISSYTDAPARIRSLIGEKLRPRPRNIDDQVDKDTSGELHEELMPRTLQLYVWQTPIMCLNFGIASYVIGFASLIFQNCGNGTGSNYATQSSLTLDGKVSE